MFIYFEWTEICILVCGYKVEVFQHFCKRKCHSVVHANFLGCEWEKERKKWRIRVWPNITIHYYVWIMDEPTRVGLLFIHSWRLFIDDSQREKMPLACDIFAAWIWFHGRCVAFGRSRTFPFVVCAPKWKWQPPVYRVNC